MGACGRILKDVPEPLPLCHSCAGQLTAGAENCPWCGIATLPPDAATRVGGPPPPSRPGPTKPDVGLGENSARPLPAMPPPPRSRPIVALTPTQVFLRAIIVLGLAYIVITIGSAAMMSVRNRACSDPRVWHMPMCQ